MFHLRMVLQCTNDEDERIQGKPKASYRSQDIQNSKVRIYPKPKN